MQELKHSKLLFAKAYAVMPMFRVDLNLDHKRSWGRGNTFSFITCKIELGFE